MTPPSRPQHRRVHQFALVLGFLTAGAAQAAPADNPPPPPGQPSALIADTEYTTRLFGRTPVEEAIAVTRHVYTASLPPAAPGEANKASDRPWAVTLLTPDDEIAGISATELIHFPDNAPVLFVGPDGIPPETMEELRRLHPVGIARHDGVQVFAVGAAANPAVMQQLTTLGLKAEAITAADDFALADRIDEIYGHIENPDSGVPTMMTSAAGGGAGVMDVFVGSTESPGLMLPITHWISHMPGAAVWIDPKADHLPAPTVDALKRRMGKAIIYVMGGPQQVPEELVRQLGQYGMVARITNDDAVAFNAPPADNPIAESVAFARMWDPMGMVGWNANGAGHGFTLVNENDWQGCVGSAILSHLGFHAPLLLLNDPNRLPAPVSDYFAVVRPTFLVSPGDGPYNMVYVVGDYARISWPVQVGVNASQEMANRHDSANGSVYIAPR
ncbi:hypothetical protein LMG28727_06391 [Paraburkholderia kirstenboschensis]|uniref:hypothetical protein n=1 Tax=Paraburkholderia kirstenboschensis TaxID=1245436 RepID=UPI000B2E8390|nr:hypothetical protein [Paraburkholderia kirstenboschensis]CAD6557491.1 hypothetical protein LMG28727_06391 [Paraburkholderia kirstenboschensis]